MEANGKDSQRQGADRRNSSIEAEQRDSDDVLAVSDDQEDTWNDEPRRQRLAEAEYE
jgi:hypothetical protein